MNPWPYPQSGALTIYDCMRPALRKGLPNNWFLKGALKGVLLNDSGHYLALTYTQSVSLCARMLLQLQRLYLVGSDPKRVRSFVQYGKDEQPKMQLDLTQYDPHNCYSNENQPDMHLHSLH